MQRWAWPGAVAACGAAVALSIGLSGHGMRPASAVPQPAAATSPPALGFTPPAAGTYRLERILRVPEGAVLDSDGSVHQLREFTRGRVTLFSFIYTYCTDAKGCPLAYTTLHTLKELVSTDARLRGRVRFVSMSFDPVSDTPAIMRRYGGADAAAAGPAPWAFLTTASPGALAPLLDGFGQDVRVVTPVSAGARAPVLSHLLKVYLIDRRGVVREIYSTAFLHPLVLRNDLLTLLAEDGAS